MTPKIKIVRDTYLEDSTLGKLYLNGKYFCHTLEDKVREEKVYGETAIPTGSFKFKVTRSRRFKRDMILIYNQKDEITLSKDNLSFKGIRIHGGNTHKDTHGCPLVAYFRTKNNTIWKTAEAALTKWAKDNGGEGVVEVVNG